MTPRDLIDRIIFAHDEVGLSKSFTEMQMNVLANYACPLQDREQPVMIDLQHDIRLQDA
jgi:hypothetical protein